LAKHATAEEEEADQGKEDLENMGFCTDLCTGDIHGWLLLPDVRKRTGRPRSKYDYRLLLSS